MLAVFAVATIAASASPLVPKAHLSETRLLSQAVCRSEGRYEIFAPDPSLLYREDGKARITSLQDLPKANHEKAVLRSVGGCSVPLVVRENVGP